MRIRIDDSTISAEGTDDLTRLSAFATAAETTVPGVRLDADGKHVWLERVAIIAAAGSFPDPTWLARLDGMIDYAGSMGWTDEAGAVRAHLEAPRD